jgi:aminoglycoside 6'-N-acetyltransferase I
MRESLWPDAAPGEHGREIDDFFAGRAREPLAVLVATTGDGLIGFVELSIRSAAEGCETDRVGYLEGWFVDQRWRRRGVGRALVEEAIAWARAQGCRELASDAEIDNRTGHRAHQALGFETTGRSVTFRKNIG